MVVNADNVEFLDEEQKIRGWENVKIDYEDMQLNCDDVRVDMKTKDALAQGNIKVLYQDITIIGEKLIYNFQTYINICRY